MENCEVVENPNIQGLVGNLRITLNEVNGLMEIIKLLLCL